MQEMRAATLGLMRWLTPPDCARFVDLVFASSGSRRVGTLGRAQKTLNVDLVLPIMGHEHASLNQGSSLIVDVHAVPPRPSGGRCQARPVRCASEGDAVVTGLPACLEGVIGQRHGDDRIGRMPAPEQIVFPAVQVLGIERVDPRADDLVPFNGPNVVPGRGRSGHARPA